MNAARRTRRVAIYARLSVATEESVSITRQIRAARSLADARGWEVVLVATDDGVSATKHRPEDREGWRRILDAAPELDAVIVWKVDRLARRVLDFLNADAALQAHGAGLVAVEDPVDMTTAQGRAFATILAVFGEMEAAAISARARAARPQILREGRAIGARPWPFESVPNPDGPGTVWRPIPERAAAVRDAVEALTAGRTSLAAIARDWSAAGLLPRRSASWNPASVRALLTSPVLTGATVHHGEPMRDASGVVVIDDARQIITPSEHRGLLAALGDGVKVRQGARPIRLPLLHGLAVCGTCGGRLVANRPASGGKPATYVCQNRDCSARVAVTLATLDEYVVAAFVEEAPNVPVEVWSEGQDDEALAALREALDAVQVALAATEDDDEEAALLARRKSLRAAIREAEDAAPLVESHTVDLRAMWDAAETDDDRRLALRGLFDRVEVRRTAVRRGSKVADRVTLVRREAVAS